MFFHCFSASLYLNLVGAQWKIMNPRIFQLQRNLGFFVPLPYILSPSWKENSLSQSSHFLHKHLLLSNLSTQLGNKVQQPKQRPIRKIATIIIVFPDRLFQRFKFNRVLRILFCRNRSLFLLLPTEERKKSAYKLKGTRIVLLPFSTTAPGDDDEA